MNNELRILLSKLPIDIQKKIYILCFREFWRNYIPLTAKVPSWYARKTAIDNIKFNAKLNNIHFLHLPFNILPENKLWIMGCQCSFCKMEKKINIRQKHIKERCQYLNGYYFKTIMPESTTTNYNDEFILNQSGNFVSFQEFGYDPLCGSAYEDRIRYSLRNNIQLDFT